MVDFHQELHRLVEALGPIDVGDEHHHNLDFHFHVGTPVWEFVPLCTRWRCYEGRRSGLHWVPLSGHADVQAWLLFMAIDALR